MKIVIVAALPSELKRIVAGWDRPHVTDKRVALWTHIDGAGDEIVSVCAGMGSVAVRRAFTAAEQGGPVDLVVNIGLAGSTGASLRLGGVTALSEVIDSKTGERYRLTDGKRVLRIATADRVADAAEKQRIAATYGAVVVDMEASEIARLAQIRSIPMCCFKAVSDEDDANLPDINRFIDDDGKLRTLAFVGYVSLRPQYWSALIRLGRGSSLASEALSLAVRDFLVHKDWDYVNRTGGFKRAG